MCYPLYTLLVEDNDGVGQPVAFGLLRREDTAHIKEFLNFFKANNGMQRTEAVVTDKDMAEISAVHECWPNVSVIICRFHILRAIEKHLSSTSMSKCDQLSCCEVSASC